MKGRLIALMVIAWMVLLAVPMAPAMGEKTGTREGGETETIVWDKTTEGPIYTYGDNDAGVVFINYYAGYSDGNGNYYVDEIVIAQNQTLEINPGVIIHFTGSWGMNIYGSIQAIGTESEPIVFTSNASTPKYGDWNGISTGFSADLTLKHCRIEYSKTLSLASSTTIENCIFYESGGISINYRDHPNSAIIRNVIHLGVTTKTIIDEISVFDASNIVFENNNYSTPNGMVQLFGQNIVCRNNHISLIYEGLNVGSSYNGSAIVDNNVVKDTYCWLSGNVHAFNNRFENPSGIALVLGLANSTHKLDHNTIIGNISYYGKYQNFTIDARYNYWGTENSKEIYDKLHQDEIRLGFPVTILYEPYLKKNGKVYTPEKEDDSILLISIGIGAAILILVILVTLVVIITRKKRSRSSDEKKG